MFRHSLCTALAALVAGASLPAAQLVTDTNAVKAPRVAAASNEGELALKRFRVPKGFKVELFAAEPLLANPVAFSIDEKGRFYVAETFRLHAGVTDIRSHMTWLDDELASQSVENRVEYMKRFEGKRIGDYTKETDRVKLVWDSNGDGKADQSTVFSTGYNNIEDGLASGVLAYRGNVYFANIPKLWLLRDGDGDGVAESRKALLHGFGVRVGFLGHDLHGLKIGPDGKLYFTIGDRGAHVTTKDGANDRTVENLEEGAVYRCNFDGTGLEIFARGLRNPQELAFDAYGNLWTGDNNSDGGDPARWVYVVEGGDSGWRIGYQFLNQPNARGVWLSERMCYPQFPGQAAFILPPLANIGNGPSGLSYYPGVGLPDRYTNHFFLCDFRGSTGSGVHSFGVKPKGAGFEVVDRHDFIWEVLVTDGDFGYDGSFYISDWVQGWNKTGKGRIYRVFDPVHVKAKSVKETKDYFAQNFETMGVNKLALLLAHPDMRVRQEAQFAIVAQGPVTAVRTFTRVVNGPGADLFARLHSIWGLGQIAPRSQLAVNELNKLLEDKDAEVRAQAAKTLGNVGLGSARTLAQLLNDESARVRFFAAMALSKFGDLESLEPLVEMLRANNDQDVYLRHAGVMTLTAMLRRAGGQPGVAVLNREPANADAARIQNAMHDLLNDKSSAVRMAVLLALRRVESPDLAEYLRDSDPLLVAEAARAINDLPIQNALTNLAALIEFSEELSAFPAGTETAPGPRDGLLRRVINANYRLGASNNAAALVAFASTSPARESLRAEAVALLGDWAKPSGRDRITGLWRPVGTRDPKIAADALQPHLSALLRTSSNKLKLAVTRAAGELNIQSEDANPFNLVSDPSAASNLRIEALKSLVRSKDEKLPEAVRVALASQDEALRKEATKIQAQLQPNDALAQLRTTLEQGSISEQQNAFATLGTLAGAEADTLLSQWLGKLLANNVKPEVTLDLLDAAAKRDHAEVRAKLRQFENTRPGGDDLRAYRECLVGGNAEDGKKIFLEKVEASCVRCHKFDGEGGEVGPELTGMGGKKDRNYILESLVFPNKTIAQGYESVTVTLKNGTAYAGQLKSETATTLEINSPEDGLMTVKKADIKTRERGLSGMPEELRQVLTKQELRDLVEFLAQSKEARAK
jgi:quinoprotein glucose dehydrogenase